MSCWENPIVISRRTKPSILFLGLVLADPVDWSHCLMQAGCSPQTGLGLSPQSLLTLGALTHCCLSRPAYPQELLEFLPPPPSGSLSHHPGLEQLFCPLSSLSGLVWPRYCGGLQPFLAACPGKGGREGVGVKPLASNGCVTQHGLCLSGQVFPVA